MRAFLISLAFVVATVGYGPFDRPHRSFATILLATSPKEQPVLDLQPAELTALVNGLPAPVEYLQAVGRSLSVVLLFDVSSSMFSPFGRREAEDFSRRVVATLRADDQVRFGEIGGGVSVGPVVPHTRAYFAAPPALIERPPDRATEAARIRWARMSSPIWDGVAAGVEAVRADDRHRLIVVVTDGLVTGSRLGLADVIPMAVAAQTAASVVDVHWAESMVVKQDNQRERTEFRPDESLRRLAAGTGGSYFAEVRARGERVRYSDMPALVAKAIAESRGAYRIGLQIPASGVLPSVKITSNRAGVVIRTPTGAERQYDRAK